MKLDVFFTHRQAEPGELEGRTVVVVDVLRATSTMVEALANGAVAVYPHAATEDAIRLAQNIGREDVLLCGERRGQRIDGFDLGNSPAEFTAERVRGRPLVMTTTNGTPALLAADDARRTLVGAFLNLSAVATALAEEGGPAAVLCAGRHGRFALEDALCAGAIATRVRDAVDEDLELNDAGVAAVALAERWADRVEEAIGQTAASRSLEPIGHGDDVAFCAAVDRHTVVPRLEDRRVFLP